MAKHSSKIINPITQLNDGPIRLKGPSDKSLTHRAFFFGAIATGVSHVENPLLGEDCLATKNAFESMGVTFEAIKNDYKVTSQGMDSFVSPKDPLDLGNSGTTARLILGLLAGIDGLQVTLTGDASLSSRPMGRVTELLRPVGADFAGRDDANLLPITIKGNVLKSGSYQIEKATAQVKSALLLAGLCTEGKTHIEMPAGSRDHTENILKKMGADIKVDIRSGREQVSLQGPFKPVASCFKVPTDPSSVAFLSVMAAIHGCQIVVPHVLQNETRTGYLAALGRFGVPFKFTHENLSDWMEPVADLEQGIPIQLKATDIEPEEVPALVDEIPILAVLAAFASGESRFKGLSELRVKESDRLAKTLELLTAAGAEVRIEGEELIIGGGLGKFTGFKYDPQHDHRMAMSAAVLATKASTASHVLYPECVAVSFPEFFEMLDSFRAG